MAKPKSKTAKNKSAENKMISLDHDFSFNLLTEPWLPVVTSKGKKQLLSLNDFIKTCHELERFDFPLPGLETAVIRFMVAMVHIVGAPKDKKEWEDWLKEGRFSEKFYKEMQKYKNKLDLFSKTEPFMQDKGFLAKEEKIVFDNISRLIHYFPFGTNPTHWFHKFDENLNCFVSPESLIWLLLLFNYTAYSGGRGYNPGINGKPPNYILLNGENLFITILLNTPNIDFLSHIAHKKLIRINEIGFPKKLGIDVEANAITLQGGFLWQTRQFLFLPEKNENNYICNISSTNNEIIIKNFIMMPQSMSLKKGSYWADPHVVKIDKGPKGIKNLNESGNLPSWREYPSLLITKGNSDNIRKAIYFAPLIIQQLSFSRNIVNNIRISYFIFSTINNAKINKILEDKYYFQTSFIDNESIKTIISSWIYLIEDFEKEIHKQLKKAFNIKPNSNAIAPEFQSAYWHELGSVFEESLAELANTNKEPGEILRDWKIMLAAHVRKTFERHTEKLISNTKYLKQYQAAKKYLEFKIRNDLEPQKMKNNEDGVVYA